MKAVVQERFGPPDVLRLVDTDPPEVGADDRLHGGLLRPAGGGKGRVWKMRRSHGLREFGECCDQAERR